MHTHCVHLSCICGACGYVLCVSAFGARARLLCTPCAPFARGCICCTCVCICCVVHALGVHACVLCTGCSLHVCASAVHACVCVRVHTAHTCAPFAQVCGVHEGAPWVLCMHTLLVCMLTRACVCKSTPGRAAEPCTRLCHPLSPSVSPGLHCEQEEDRCLHRNPCLHGGTCKDNTCLCPPGYSGPLCQHSEWGTPGDTWGHGGDTCHPVPNPSRPQIQRWRSWSRTGRRAAGAAVGP